MPEDYLYSAVDVDPVQHVPGRTDDLRGDSEQLEDIDKTKKAPTSCCLAVCLPIMVFFNFYVLVNAHLAVGAITQVNGTAPFNQLQPHVASEDTLITAVAKLAKAQAWGMVVIVALLSGLWPYAKLCGTLCIMWSVRCTCSSSEKAHRRLLILESFGKWSFADVFLMSLNVVIFNISTPTYHTPLGDLQIDIHMELQEGGYALIAGIVLSTFLTHWTAHELAQSAQHARYLAPVAGTSGQLTLSRERLAEKSHSRWNVLVTVFSALISTTLLLCGCRLSFLTIDRNGFLGLLIGKEPWERNLRFSVISLAFEIQDKASDALAVGFFFLVGVAPLLELLLLIAVASLSRFTEYWSCICRAGAEWASSFNCVEVLLIVASVTVVQLPTVVKFNVGHECASFQGIMANKAMLDMAGIGFATSKECFAPTSSIQVGWWFLLASSAFRFTSWRLWFCGGE